MPELVLSGIYAPINPLKIEGWTSQHSISDSSSIKIYYSDSYSDSATSSPFLTKLSAFLVKGDILIWSLLRVYVSKIWGLFGNLFGTQDVQMYF